MTKNKSSKEMLDKAMNMDLIVKAMEAYAEQEALGFQSWLNTQGKENKVGERGLMKLWYDYKIQRNYSK